MSDASLLHVARLAALEAGELLLEGFDSPMKIESKEGKQNLVTEYDRKSQKLIIEKIQSYFPSHHFLAEEDGFKEAPSDEVLWIIDPLDGTVNFAHGIPFFAVSIAAARGKEILCGVVFHPIGQEMFSAELGSGAQLNGKKLSASKQKNLDDALLATGFPYDVDTNPLRCIDRFSQIVSTGTPIRRLGVASLDLAYVAKGRFDAFWEVGLHSWDMAAAKLMIEESGGKVSGYDGSPHPIYGYHPTLASNGHLHQQMVDLLKEDLP